jgi:DNA-binding transcriptional LysR family regulator
MLIIASFDGRISMELRHLATFRTLATTLNFTQTAALLGYVQSSVSAQIQELEAELGVLLFDRLNRRVILMFPRFGNALDILSEYCEERYEEALAAYRQASECSASEPSSYEKQAQVLEKWASKLRKRAMGLRS